MSLYKKSDLKIYSLHQCLKNILSVSALAFLACLGSNVVGMENEQNPLIIKQLNHSQHKIMQANFKEYEKIVLLNQEMDKEINEKGIIFKHTMDGIFLNLLGSVHLI